MSVAWLFTVSLVASNGMAAEFGTAPDVGDRIVSLSWDPDPDDPIFDGNTILEKQTELQFIHSPGNTVIGLLPVPGGRDVYSYAAGESTVKRWNRDSDVVVSELTRGSAAEVAGLSIHASGQIVGAALETGEVELWDTSVPGTARLFTIADDPLTDMKFFPGVSDPTDLRFVATADSFVYVMAGPEDRTFKIRSVAGLINTTAINRAGTHVAGGGEDGTVRLWNLTQNPEEQGPFTSNRADPHPGPIRQFEFSRDGLRLVSVDNTGQVRISRVADQPVLETRATFDVPSNGRGPRVSFSIPTGSVLVVAREDGVVQIHDGETGAFLREASFSDTDALTTIVATPDGERSLFGTDNGTIIVGRAERCLPSEQNPVCFGGYKLWRNVRPDTAGVILLRSFAFGDSTWTFVDDVRSFQDPDSVIFRTNPPGIPNPPPDDGPGVSGPHNGVPYFYSLTRFNRVFHEGSVFDVLLNSIIDGFYRDPGETEPRAIVPQSIGRGELPLLGEVVPVPNPYEAGEAPWDEIGGEHIEFRNLPESASIRIYTVAGDIVRVIEHGPGRYGESRSAAIWDLRNSQGRRVASGVYFYQVETESGEIDQGFCTIIL